MVRPHPERVRTLSSSARKQSKSSARRPPVIPSGMGDRFPQAPPLPLSQEPRSLDRQLSRCNRARVGWRRLLTGMRTSFTRQDASGSTRNSTTRTVELGEHSLSSSKGSGRRHSVPRRNAPAVYPEIGGGCTEETGDLLRVGGGDHHLRVHAGLFQHPDATRRIHLRQRVVQQQQWPCAPRRRQRLGLGQPQGKGQRPRLPPGRRTPACRRRSPICRSHLGAGPTAVAAVACSLRAVSLNSAL